MNVSKAVNLTNRGILFIDEINRLADTSPQITDILLDVMGTKPGRLQMEETGLNFQELPVSISVWAASNPDEERGHLKALFKKNRADKIRISFWKKSYKCSRQGYLPSWRRQHGSFEVA